MPEPIVISHSELDAMRACPHKWELTYRQRWAPTRVTPALSIGRTWHAVLATHYLAVQAGATDQARHRAIAELLLAEGQDGGLDGPERADKVAWMFDGYEELYGLDPQWEIVSVEDQRLIRLPMPTKRGPRPSRFYLRMRADLLIRDKTLVSVASGKSRSKLEVVDHKSGQNLPKERELALDDQFGLYTWGLRSLGEPVFGAIYSAARTQRNTTVPQPLDERFSRTRMYRTDQELMTIALEAYITARTAYRYKDGEPPRAPDTIPIGPMRCTAKCSFTEPCLTGRKMGPAAEQRFLRDGGFLQRTESEQLAERGYPDPLMPPGVDSQP